MIFKDEVGILVNLTVTEVPDIGATEGALTVWCTKPDGTTIEWDPIVIDDGPSGLAHYITEAGDLDQVGGYRVQGKWVPVANPTYLFKADLAQFTVYEPDI